MDIYDQFPSQQANARNLRGIHATACDPNQNPIKAPRLGDFSKLAIIPTPSNDQSIQFDNADNHVHLRHVGSHVNHSAPSVADGLNVLGNFAKIFHQLRPDVSRFSRDEEEAGLVDALSDTIAMKKANTGSIKGRSRRVRRRDAAGNSHTGRSVDATTVSGHISDTTVSSLSEIESAAELDASDVTPATTPSGSLAKESPLGAQAHQASRDDLTSRQVPSSNHDRVLFDWQEGDDLPYVSKQRPEIVAAVSRRTPRERSAKPLRPVLSYQLSQHGPFIPIKGISGRSEEAKHKSLSASLVQYYVGDAVAGSLYPTAKANGVHVFLDLSNIQISLHHALRIRYGLDPHTRFSPVPRLNMAFLTEILIRQRLVRALNAGCSHRPDRSEPCFVDQLRRLGYHVDVRERRRVEGARSPAPPPSKRVSSGPEDVRYVEDLVDETLQIRIGESVMEYFEEQGTLVLATGDAKPAKYSDGFLTYAERALRMGWNVEVVSWNLSLSSSWKDPSWTKRWGHRFRLIELDEFLDDLWTIGD
jgi:hypothetical protein